ncbi:MAG: hypothetical protein IJ635_07590 [Bacteroidaceae bacterium]|nr:hypothetical protein [Bacteroidaceae bacterium]MBR1521086.1 hypothetical protein [Bacteroidaceae bacterium]
MKNVKDLTAWLPMMLAVLFSPLFANCSNDDDSFDPSAPVIVEGEQDVLKGRLVYALDADSLDQYEMPLASLSDVDLHVYDRSDYYGVRVEKRQGERVLVPYQKKEPKAGTIEALRVRVMPKKRSDEARNAVVIIYKRTDEASTRAGGGVTSNYSDIIGRTTLPTNELNHQEQILLDMPRLKNVTGMTDPDFPRLTYNETDYLAANTSNSRIVDFAYDNQSMDEVTNSFNLNIGLSWLFPLGKMLFNGAFDFGYHKTEFSSSAYEYMLAMRRIEKATVQFDMRKFEDNGLNSSIMLSHHFRVLAMLTNITFWDHILNSNMNAEAVYDYWGTDMIQEGTFGGLYTYIYGRQENACGSTTGWDAGLDLGLHTKLGDNAAPKADSATTAQVLLWKFKSEAASKVGGNFAFDIGSEDSEYHEASKAFSLDFRWGGGNGSTDAAWMSGFDNNDNWALVSYSAHSNTQETSTETNNQGGTLYPLHKMAENLSTGYKAMFALEGLTHRDSILVNRMEANAKKLAEARQDYLNSLAQDWADQEYVLADLMMVSTDADPKTGHPAGEPKPIVRSDPFGVKRIYYPMMANDYAPVDRGYAFETGQPKALKTKTYINDDNVDKNQYWYYALAPINETPGIENVHFTEDRGEFHDDYIRRGESAKTGIKWKDAEDRYVYIRYFKEAKDSNHPIRAVRMKCGYDGNQTGIANSGGAELAPGGSTQTQIYDEWHNREWEALGKAGIWFRNFEHHDSDKGYGWNVYMSHSTDRLRIKSIKEIHQPKRWGE